MGRLTALTAGLVLACTVSACSGGEPEEERTLELGGDSSSAAPEEEAGDDLPPGTPEIRPAPEQGESVEQEDVGVYPVTLPDDERGRAVAQAFVDYLDVRLGAFNSGSADVGALGRVASGEALTGVQGYTATLADRGAKTVGDVWVRISDDQVTGGDRIRGGCLLNASVDVDDQGTALESPPDAYTINARITEAGPDTFLVSSFLLEPVASC